MPSVWEDYTGPNAMLDKEAKTLTIQTSIDPVDYALDEQIYHLRVGVASVSSLADAFHPVFWDVTVRF